jgi:hypothetical protein
MKTLFVLLTFLFLSIQSFAQDQFIDYRLNGVKNPTTLSKSDKNVLTLEGASCEQFLLTGSGVAISKTEKGYVLVASKSRKKVTVNIYCRHNNQSVLLRKIEFKVVR